MSSKLLRSFRKLLSTPRKGRRSRREYRALNLELLEERLTPAVYNVTSLADGFATAGVTMVTPGVYDAPSLRAAIQASNTGTDINNTINLTLPGIYAINIPGGDTDNSDGEFAITTNNLTILNTSGSPVTISGGGGLSSVFDIASDASTDNINVIIGDPSEPSITIEGGGGNDSDGGAIDVGASSPDVNASSLTLNNVIVTKNSNFGDGGAIALAGNGTLTLNGCTVDDNSTNGDGGAIVASAFGSGGTIQINNSTISDNSAGGDGGGIEIAPFRNGTTQLNVINSTISGNIEYGSGDDESFPSGGGGINAESDNNIFVSGSLFANNQAVGGQGGGLNDDTGESVTILNSQFTGNETFSGGADGGGIRVAGDITLNLAQSTIDNNIAFGGSGVEYFSTSTNSTLTNDTIVGNISVNDGAGVRVAFGAVTLVSDTINGNIADDYGIGGIYATGGNVVLENTVVAGNLNGPTASTLDGYDIGADSGSTITSLGGNFVGVTAPVTITPVAQDQFNTGADPGILPLANNGGPIIGDPRTAIPLPTEALSSTSPLIESGLANPDVATDERGYPRPDTGLVPDIGAFEYQLAPVITANPTASTTGYGGGATFGVTAIGPISVQWQVSTDGGVTWTNLSNGFNYSGVTTSTLSVSSASIVFDGNYYRAVVSNLGGIVTTPGAQLLVISGYTAAAYTNAYDAYLYAYDAYITGGTSYTAYLNAYYSLVYSYDAYYYNSIGQSGTSEFYAYYAYYYGFYAAYESFDGYVATNNIYAYYAYYYGYFDWVYSYISYSGY